MFDLCLWNLILNSVDVGPILLYIAILFRTQVLDFVMALILIVQGLFAGNVLRLACWVTFVTSFYSYDCYFAFNLIFFVSLNYVAYISLYL